MSNSSLVTKAADMEKFRASLGQLLEETDELKPSKATLTDYVKNGQGDLEEGVQTTMKLGDLEVFGRPEDAPEVDAVERFYEHFYAGREEKSSGELAAHDYSNWNRRNEAWGLEVDLRNRQDQIVGIPAIAQRVEGGCVA
jgi:hypothetical protein